MARGAAKLTSAVFASVVLIAPLAHAQDATEPATPDRPAAVSDDCLAAPNGEAPLGQHWFYRTERGTQRHCWYLRDKPERISQPALVSLPAAKPSARTNEAAASRPAAVAPRPSTDARAELPAGPRGRFENDGPTAPRLQTTPAMAAKAATMAADDDIRGTQTGSLSQPLDTFSAPPPSPDSSATAPDNAGADANPNAASASALVPTADTNAGMNTAPPKSSLRLLLMVIFGALAFAGVTASLTHRLAGVWRKRAARLRRRVMWKPANIVRSRPTPAAKAGGAIPKQNTIAAAPGQPDDAQDQIEELLSRVAKRREEPSAPVLLAKSRVAAAAPAQRSSGRRGARA